MADSHENPHNAGNKPPEESHSLDRMEDDFYVLCAAIRRECDESMRREEGHEEENFPICQKATSRYDAEAVPAFDNIVRVAGKDSPACRRARERAASCLHGLALNHAWAGRRDIAETLTQRAKELAPEGSLVLSRIEETIFSPGVMAHGMKKTGHDEPAIKLEPEKKASKDYGVWVAAGVGLVLGMVVVIYAGKGGKDTIPPAPAPAAEKSAAVAPVVTPPKEDVVATTIKESASQAAPPSARDFHLKPPGEKGRPAQPEVKQAAPKADSVPLAQKVSPEPANVSLERKTEQKSVSMAKESEKTAVAKSAPKPRVTKPSEIKGPPVDAKESRVVTLKAVLDRTEAKLNKILKDLESREKEIASNRSTLELYEQQKGADSAAYRQAGEEHNRLIRDYNKRLAEARKVAAEHDALLKEYRQLVGAQNTAGQH